MTVWAEAEAQSSESWGEVATAQFESPFVGAAEFAGEAEQTFPSYGELGVMELPFATPFTPEAESGSTQAEAIAEVLAELASPELHEALGELMQEASGIHADRFALSAAEVFESGSQMAEQAVRAHFEPLAPRSPAVRPRPAMRMPPTTPLTPTANGYARR